MEDIVIVSAVRTAVGKFGGTLAKTPVPELGAAVIRSLLDVGQGPGHGCASRHAKTPVHFRAGVVAGFIVTHLRHPCVGRALRRVG